MSPAVLSSGRAMRFRTGGATAADSETYERLMFLELATDLQNWPVRNTVVREALDRAAQDLVALAGKAGLTA